MMTKTDYVNVATVLRLHVPDIDHRWELANRLSQRFEGRDSKFSRSRFLRSAALFPCGKCGRKFESKHGWFEHHQNEHSTKETASHGTEEEV
jgi:hypothetical protein